MVIIIIDQENKQKEAEKKDHVINSKCKAGLRTQTYLHSAERSNDRKYFYDRQTRNKQFNGLFVKKLIPCCLASAQGWRQDKVRTKQWHECFHHILMSVITEQTHGNIESTFSAVFKMCAMKRRSLSYFKKNAQFWLLCSIAGWETRT